MRGFTGWLPTGRTLRTACDKGSQKPSEINWRIALGRPAGEFYDVLWAGIWISFFGNQQEVGLHLPKFQIWSIWSPKPRGFHEQEMELNQQTFQFTLIYNWNFCGYHHRRPQKHPQIQFFLTCSFTSTWFLKIFQHFFARRSHHRCRHGARRRWTCLRWTRKLAGSWHGTWKISWVCHGTKISSMDGEIGWDGLGWGELFVDCSIQ